MTVPVMLTRSNTSCAVAPRRGRFAAHRESTRHHLSVPQRPLHPQALDPALPSPSISGRAGLT
jgi:hypothetical protein